MEQVDGDQIAPTGNLNFDTDADVPGTTVYGLALDPVNAAGFLLHPTVRILKSFVDHRPDGASAVCVSLLFNQQLETRYDRADVCEEFIKTEPFNEIFGSVKSLLVNDFWHTGILISKAGFGSFRTPESCFGNPRCAWITFLENRSSVSEQSTISEPSQLRLSSSAAS
jgi:hypothetical protein